MRTSNKELTFYVYVRIGPKEGPWREGVAKYIAELGEKGLRYVPSEFGDCRKNPQDIYSNGTMGAPLFFKAVGNPLAL